MVSRLGLLAILATLTLALGAPLARADEQKQLIAISAQKLESDYRDALKQAFDVGKKDPGKALEILTDMVQRVEPNKAITDVRRKQMLDALTDRILGYEQEMKKGSAKDAGDADKEIIKRDKAEQLKLEEDKQNDLQKTLAEIRKLKAEGKNAEAAKLADDLAQRRGKTPETIASYGTASVQEQLNEYKRLQAEKSRRTTLTIRDVEKSAMPPIGDIEFPDAKKWKELTARRKAQQNPLSEKEKALLKALNTPITVSFKDKSLREVLEAIEAKTGQTISVSKDTLDAAALTYESAVSINVKGVTTRTMLKKLLADLGLTFVIKNESIVVMTPLEAKETMAVRVYYLGDIATLTDFRFPPIVNQQLMAQSMYNLVEMIQSIDPPSWKANGGPGTISIDPRTLSLIVKQSAEMHYILGGALK